jgi:excisionase family DNA binding protein
VPYDTDMTQLNESPLPVVDWMTVAEVATYLRISRMSVWRWVNDGKLPAMRAGRSIRIDPKHVQELITPKTAPK